MAESDFKAAVGMSRKWDAREAGREVAQDTLNKLGKDVKPDFFLLFSTIHYEKHGGFKEFLKGVWEILPKGTPLVGGTVAGFMNQEGCYTRGASALAVNYSNMKVAVGFGKNTKRNPIKAAENCSRMIKDSLPSGKNNYFISIISGPKVPDLPVIGRKKVVDNITGLTTILKFFDFFTRITQFGPGRDEEVFAFLSSQLKTFEGIGGASADNLELKTNYQFLHREVITNAIVLLAISIDFKVEVKSSMSLKPTGIVFNITKSSAGGYLVEKMDKGLAVQTYLKKMGWSEDFLDERLYRKVFYYPFVPKNKDHLVKSQMLGLVYGNNFICPTKPPKNEDLEICISSGSAMINSMKSILDKKRNAFLVICGTRLETLGSRVYDVKKIIDDNILGDYLGIFTAGEYSRISNNTAYMFQSDNSMLY